MRGISIPLKSRPDIKKLNKLCIASNVGRRAIGSERTLYDCFITNNMK